MRSAMMMRFLFLFLFPILSIELWAQSSGNKIPLPKLSILDTTRGNKQALGWKRVITPLWEVNNEGAFEFFWLVRFRLPGDINIKNLKAEKGLINIRESESGSEVLFKMNAMNDRLYTGDLAQPDREISFNLKLPQFLYITEGCDIYSLEISSPEIVNKKNNLSGYMAYRCDATNVGFTLAVSTPAEFQWSSSTLFEQKGKGKRWRVFDLNPQVSQTERNEIGSFKLDQGKKLYPFQIVIDRIEVARKISAFRFSLGAMQLGFNAGTNQYSQTKLGAHMAFEVRPFNAKISIGGHGFASLPSLQTGEYFTHINAVGYSGYLFAFKNNWTLEPRLYLAMAEGINQKSQLYFILNSLAIGNMLTKRLNEKWLLGFELYFMDTGNQLIQSLKLSVSKETRPRNGWGFVLSYDNLQANTSGSNPVGANQVYLGPFVDF